MSKSLGNVIDPLDVIKRSGADILRLWVASADYTSDIAASPEILERVTEAYRRMRNTARFMLGNLYDFDIREHTLHYSELEELDRWALIRLKRLMDRVTEAYENYRFHLIYHHVYDFCVKDLSAFYLDIVKDRLYTWSSNSRERRSTQTALWHILATLTKIISPILVFTSEEILQALPYKEDESVQFCSWPDLNREYLDTQLEKRWEGLLMIRQEVYKALEIARNSGIIGDSLEARVEIYPKDENYDLINSYRDLLSTLLIVSQVEVFRGAAPSQAFTGEEVAVLVSKAKGTKCERCWNYSETVGEYNSHPTICSKCVKVIKDIE